MKTVEEYMTELSAMNAEFSDEITEKVLGEFIEISVTPMSDFTKFKVNMLDHKTGGDLGSNYSITVDLQVHYDLLQ